MAERQGSASNVVIIEDWTSRPVPTLRLTRPAPTSEARRFLVRCYHWILNSVPDAADIEEGCAPAVTERNEIRIRHYFAEMRKGMNEIEEKVIADLPKFSEAQQEQIITFWSSVQKFMTDIWDWLKEVFSVVVEKIKAGARLVAEKLKSALNTVIEAIKKAFDQ